MTVEQMNVDAFCVTGMDTAPSCQPATIALEAIAYRPKPRTTGGQIRKSLAGREKSPRWNIPGQALFMLEHVYALEKFPSLFMRQRLAKDFGVTPRQVQVWFQNRRQREREPDETSPRSPPTAGELAAEAVPDVAAEALSDGSMASPELSSSESSPVMPKATLVDEPLEAMALPKPASAASLPALAPSPPPADTPPGVAALEAEVAALHSTLTQQAAHAAFSTDRFGREAFMPGHAASELMRPQPAAARAEPPAAAAVPPPPGAEAIAVVAHLDHMLGIAPPAAEQQMTPPMSPMMVPEPMSEQKMLPSPAQLPPTQQAAAATCMPLFLADDLSPAQLPQPMLPQPMLSLPTPGSAPPSPPKPGLEAAALGSTAGFGGGVAHPVHDEGWRLPAAGCVAPAPAVQLGGEGREWHLPSAFDIAPSTAPSTSPSTLLDEARKCLVAASAGAPLPDVESMCPNVFLEQLLCI